MPHLHHASLLPSIACVAGALLACGGSSSSKSTPEQRVIYSDGITLHLASFDGTSLTDVDTAAVPSAGLLAGHTIFSVIEHPTKSLLYVTSFNECYATGDWCWGNARIDIFRASKNALTWVKPAFVYDETQTTASCATDVSEYEGQVGECAPVNGVFSADGTRLYVQDDDYDVLHIFSVAGDDTLALLEEGGDLSLHGLAKSATGDYLYNGSQVLTVTGDVGENTTDGTGGNDTVILHPMTGDDLLFTTLDNSSVSVLSLTDPAAPAEIDTLDLGENLARAAMVNAELTGAMVVGRDNVATVGFDGETLTLADSLDLAGDPDPVENRSVAVVDDMHALVSWFQLSDMAPSGWVGGVTVYAIDGDGLITPGETTSVDGSARVVKVMTLN